MAVSPSMRRLLYVLALSVAVGGCSTYAPTTLPELSPGSRVRVQIDPAVIGRVQEITRSNEDAVLDGSVVGVTADSLTLAVWRTDVLSTRAAGFNPGTVQVPLERSDVVTVSRREVSAVRTGLLGALLAGVAYFVVHEAFGGSGGGIVDGGGGGPDIILLPIRLGR